MIISYITIVYCQNQEIDTGMVVFTKLLSCLDFTNLCVHVFYHMCRFMLPPLSEYRTAPSPQRTTLSPFSSWSLHPPVTLGIHWSVLYHDTLSFQECCINGIIDHCGFLFLKCSLFICVKNIFFWKKLSPKFQMISVFISMNITQEFSNT